MKDLFIPIVNQDKLNPNFKHMMINPSAEPARLMANKIFDELPNPDGNFIEQFQTTGYDARIFELSLFAYLLNSGCEVNRDFETPDFIIKKLGFECAIEITTTNPSTIISSTPMDQLTPEKIKEQLHNELPIRFGSALFSKLVKRYWELDQCKGKPIIFAIEAFHEEGSLYHSDAALMQYLYGLRFSHEWSEDGDLIIKDEPIKEHKLKGKVIPSNFFYQEDAEYISAVLFCNSGTYAKFARMGFQAGYHRGNIIIIRRGSCYDSDPKATKPIPFAYDLDERPIPETWGEGMMVFHNPNARYPISKDFFTDVGNTYYYDGETHTFLPRFYPYMSQTPIVSFNRGQIDDLQENRKLDVQSILKSEFHSLFEAPFPMPGFIAVEKEWFANKKRTVLGAVLLDSSDNDWSYVILQKAEEGIFHYIDGEVSLDTKEVAREKLINKMKEIG